MPSSCLISNLFRALTFCLLALVFISVVFANLRDETDDYGSLFQAGNAVVKGNFFLRHNLIDMTFKLDVRKTAIVYPGTVRYVCSELKKKGRGRNEVYQVPMDVHEDIIASL